MLRVAFIASLLSISVVTLAAEQATNRIDDKTTMQGHWTRLYAQAGDKIVKGYEGMQWVMYGDGGCNIYSNGKTEDFKIILDQTASPKRMTMKFGKQTIRAIYQLEGDRLLTIPLEGVSEEWPTKFEVGPHDLLLVDKRTIAELPDSNDDSLR